MSGEGLVEMLQVDLKLKICRGTSVRKILVREAKAYSAAKIIVGTARSHHKIRSSTSVAKYCAKKLSKDCWVLAVNNGKVVFKREGSPTTIGHSKGLGFFIDLLFLNEISHGCSTIFLVMFLMQELKIIAEIVYLA
jgi:hypothetical protein